MSVAIDTSVFAAIGWTDSTVLPAGSLTGHTCPGVVKARVWQPWQSAELVAVSVTDPKTVAVGPP